MGFPVTCGMLALGQPASAGGAEVTALQAALGPALWPSASEQNRGEFGVLMRPWPLTLPEKAGLIENMSNKVLSLEHRKEAGTKCCSCLPG